MSKEPTDVELLREAVIDIMNCLNGDKMVDRLIQAVIDREWTLVERVLGAREDLTLGPSGDGSDWAVHKEEFFITGRASTAREAMLAAAKELGIEVGSE